MVGVELPDFDPRLARAVKIKVVSGANGEATIGTGFLLASGLVLTARHVLHRDGKAAHGDYDVAELRVRSETGPGAGVSAPVSKLIVLGEVSGLDAAVLICSGVEPVVGTTVVGAVATGDRPLPECSMIGFPRAAQGPGTVGAEYVGVSVLPVSGAAAGRLAVQVTTPPAREDRDWGGLSGSGVIDSRGRLLGLLTAVQVRWEQRLAVAPIREIAIAAMDLVLEHAELAPLAELPVAEYTGEEPLFDTSKFPPRLTDLVGESLFDALQFKYRVVPFLADRSRGQALDGTLRWIANVEVKPDLQVGVVTGPAGVGKSRLAAEVCDRLTANQPWWRAGFVDAAKLLTAPVPVVPTLVVCDYPERHPEALGDYLSRIRDERRAGLLQAPVRVLLVSRDERSWHDQVRSRCKNLDQLTGHRIALSLDQFGPDEQTRHAAQAFTSFCRGLRIPEERRPNFEIDHASFDRPLLVHIAALLAAWQHTQPDAETAHNQTREDTAAASPLLDDLIDAEVERLLRLQRPDGTAAGAPMFNSSGEVREALCVTTLTAPLRRDLPDLLACTEAYGPNGNANRIAAADALLRCFPANVPESAADPLQRPIAPVEPDLIAAHLLARTPGRSAIVKRLVASTPVSERPAYHAQLVGTLALAAEDYPDVAVDLKEHLAATLSRLIDAGPIGAASISGLLADRLVPLTLAAVAAAADQDLTPARHLATALSLPDLGRDQDVDAAAASASNRLPYPHVGLAALGVALGTREVAHLERTGDYVGLAAAYNDLGNWLSDHGLRNEGLVAAERSKDLFLHLAVVDSARFLPYLAASVSNLSNRLAEAGREEALAEAERAVVLWEELTGADRAAYLPSLAASASNLSNRLAEAGRQNEALAEAERAVGLYEELADGDRAAHVPGLAGASHNLADRLAAAGRRDEALAEAERAVGLYEELADGDRAAYLPGLATSVGNLRIRLAAVGQQEKALVATQRVVDIGEELARIDRDGYLPDLARALIDLAIDLEEAGRLEESLAAAMRAVGCYEDLAETAHYYQSDLAWSVSDLAIRLATVGRGEEALAEAMRAVDIGEELAGLDREVYLSDLATAFWTAAYVRQVLDIDRVDALAYCDRAIDLYRELVATFPDAFQESLAAVEVLRDELAQQGDASNKPDTPVITAHACATTPHGLHGPGVGRCGR